MIVRSKYLIDSNGHTTEDAEVTVKDNRIVSVQSKAFGAAPTDAEIVDLGRAVILPGLVNAHAHLELTQAHSLVQPQPRFTDWIREVVCATGTWTDETFSSSLREGIRRSVASGTTSIGDIGGRALDRTAYTESGMRVRLFHEVIGFDPDAAGRTIEDLKEWIARTPAGDKLSVGICPHTPYTVSERLLKRCAELAREKNLPLCIHLAETRGELEFLRAGTGEMLEFRNEFGLWPEWKPPRTSPVRYLQHLEFFEKPATLIHCNYVSEDEYDIIAASGSSVVFCPRSHDYFRHREHPFLKMLGHGINVALGTDSLISSPSLGILDEMKFLYREYPEIEPAVLLRMATTNGAKALGLPSDIGRLVPGSPADMVGIALPGEAIEGKDNPLDAVFLQDSKVVFSMVNGEITYWKHAADNV